MTSSPPIATSAIDVVLNKRCQSLQGKHLARDEGGHGNNPPRCHKAALPMNTTRASWERCEHHHKTYVAKTIIVAGVSIAATPVRQNKQEDIPWQEASSRSGKIKPLISYDASVGIDKNDQQKQAAKTAQPPWHVEHASCARHSQYAQRRQVN
jgi:hypothetical protein